MFVHLQPETLKWILPIVVTVFFGLIGAVFTWVKDVSAPARKGRLLDQATKRIEFWTKWLDAVKVYEIPATAEQITAAHSEFSKTADVVHEALRFWPLPQKWTPDEFRARWKKLWIPRRLFMWYDLHNGRARWERLALYALALYICSAVGVQAYDNRPDSTSVYVHTGGYDGFPAPKGFDGFGTTLGDVRKETRFYDCLLVLVLVAGRFVIFLDEWFWMMPISADPKWFRRPQAPS
jgi:hypothetical protein